MSTLHRLLTNICSERLTESKDFYTSLFDFTVQYDSDWFVQLVSQSKQLELGLIDRKSDLIPADFQTHPAGCYLTLVVDDADALFAVAQKLNFATLSAPADTFYGQRRFLLTDPNGVLIDVSSPIKDFSSTRL